MIEELSVVLRKQTPNPPNEWLYESIEEGGQEKRNFVPFAYLGKNAEPWPECTDEEKVQWEEEHKEPEPTPEPSDSGSEPADPANVPADPANEGKEAEV